MTFVWLDLAVELVERCIMAPFQMLLLFLLLLSLLLFHTVVVGPQRLQHSGL